MNKKEKIRKILILLMFIIGINIYSFDGQNLIYKRILDEHDPNSKSIKIELRENDMTFTGKKEVEQSSFQITK
ncbi:hypothetical protein EII29_01290 [Leptotrichia sp. OH3620_COT-345]|uniref:hypothetical protein n=1 Tax=Leptotrichia sp. OH3620_COT-345 TaxID=2491048 RepID=UPI000F64901C|nr:hypothetical protein [Leptotrichia sp. OH3620_COT-345]RRD40605.1 hypothetical protein EII29_01290 [Leptotrichia sp. OH3620_COT-345]